MPKSVEKCENKAYVKMAQRQGSFHRPKSGKGVTTYPL